MTQGGRLRVGLSHADGDEVLRSYRTTSRAYGNRPTARIPN